jgi:hypothetical protein
MINLLTRALSSIPRQVFGETWTARDSDRGWAKVAMSGNGQYQIAYTDSIGTGANQLYVSSDYGNTWSAKESPRVWSDIKLSFDGQTQIATENNPTSGRVFVSYNFGNTWEAKGPIIEEFYIYSFKFVGMSFDGQIITALTNGFVYRSLDSGNTWSLVSSETAPWTQSETFFGIIMSLNGQHQTVGTFNDVFISNNYGANWTRSLLCHDGSQPVISTNGQIQMLFCRENQFQDFPRINVSTDFGNTWVKRDYLNFRDWRKLAISSDGTRAAGIVGGTQVFVSSNSGVNWALKLSVSFVVNLSSIEMSLNGKIMAAAGFGGVYISTDYGETWALKLSSGGIRDLKIAQDGTHGTAVQNVGKIYTTQRTRLI